jgi:glycerophosphoryl diester phosphodiesterase
MEKPLNIAHRGGAGLWPENTLFALAEAARAGFDGAEIDVQLTRDRQLAVFHDFHLKPALCRGPNGKWLTRRRGPLPLICDSDYAELSQFDVGRVRANSAYGLHHKPLHQRDGERIPLLSEAIATVRSAHKSFRLFIEIKTSYQNRALSAPPEAVAEAVVEELRRARLIDHAVLVGFDWVALIHAKRLEPKLSCWFTTRPRPRTSRAAWAGGFSPAKFGGSIPEAIREAGGEGWFCSHRQASRRAVDEARRCGLKLGVWTVNRKRDMRAFAKLGVDAIVTDRPDCLATL